MIQNDDDEYRFCYLLDTHKKKEFGIYHIL